MVESRDPIAIWASVLRVEKGSGWNVYLTTYLLVQLKNATSVGFQLTDLVFYKATR